MLTTVIAAATLSRPLDVDNSSRKLLTTAAKKYAACLSMSGTITNAISDGEGTIVTTTTFAYVQPSRFMMQQKQDSEHGGTFRAGSDGKTFTYDPPLEVSETERRRAPLSEPVKKFITKKGDFHMMTVPEMYIAASHSFPDASPVHDLVMGAGVNVDSWLKNVTSVSSPVKEDLHGVKVTMISGNYRSIRATYDGDDAALPVVTQGSGGIVMPSKVKVRSESAPAKFYFYFDDQGLVTRFKTVESYVVKKKSAYLASIWDIKVAINPDIPLSAYKPY